MPSETRRHFEPFGPDWSRGPFTSNSPPVAAVQMAAQLAQLRAPITRADADILSHAEFIRSLADRLLPDFAQQVGIAVGPEIADEITSTIRDESGEVSLLRCWLADNVGGGETPTAPDAVDWGSAVVLQTITADRHYLVIAPSSGVISPKVSYAGNRTWRWAVQRSGRVYYSPPLDFN